MFSGRNSVFSGRRGFVDALVHAFSRWISASPSDDGGGGDIFDGTLDFGDAANSGLIVLLEDI